MVESTAATTWIREPLKPTGVLDDQNYNDVTPVIGREYPDLKITDLLNAPNADELIREMAIIISIRGVVFFRNQDLTIAQQKAFVYKVSKLAGSPKESGFHRHPSGQGYQELVIDQDAAKDEDIYVVSNQLMKKIFDSSKRNKKVTSQAGQWHTDLMFERVPADYSCLRMHTNPPTGGDTLWASGTAMYNLLSAPYQRYLQTLTMHSASPSVADGAKRGGFELITENRGHPLNKGDDFTADHPVIRTNPVTGKNGIYAVGLHVKNINDVSEAESDAMLKSFLDLITQNHGLQVRWHWTKNDVAIWDNRSVYHAATPDFDINIPREGARCTTIGEIGYFDPYTNHLVDTKSATTNGVNGHK